MISERSQLSRLQAQDQEENFIPPELYDVDTDSESEIEEIVAANEQH